MAKNHGLSIAICGQAGQGIKTVEGLLQLLFHRAGLHVFTTKEYMSRIRGGMNSTTVRVSSRPVRALRAGLDVALILDRGGADHLGERISPETVVAGEEDDLTPEEKGRGVFLAVPWRAIAKELGGSFYLNTAAAGVLAGLLAADREAMASAVAEKFSAKGEEVAGKNREAFGRGFDAGERFRKDRDLELSLPSPAGEAGKVIFNGAEAVALGALAGGCNFLSFYPMSPATGVGVFIAGQAGELGVEVEQAEDEIAAANMALGAWYAGGRGLVTTSGGGFALMVESLSLAGVTETPLVIHLGQRPGPGTGLPTRTEQGDLLFTLFAGHGDFPRIILAPGSVEEAFYLTREAFNLADRFQVPVIVLTDQYLLDSYRDLAPFDLSGFEVENSFVETGPDYRRYALTEDGISPRGIPGRGEGLVRADSDEHDEYGRITEDAAVRAAMVEKRFRKLAEIEKEVPEPEYSGPENCRTLIIGWGSTREAVREALEEAGLESAGHLHFSRLFPLPPGLKDRLEKAERLVAVENNATGQFADLIELRTGVKIERRILKADGGPFTVEELAESLKKEAAR